MNYIVEFKKTRNRYKIIINDILMKNPETREWQEAIIYKEYKHWNPETKDYDLVDDPKRFVRLKSEFIEKFELVLDL